MSTQRHTRGVWSTPRPLGPNGERLCYNCRGPLPKGRPYNCSPACSEAWRCRTSPSHMRWLLRQRDKGVCALCGLDMIALKLEHQKLSRAEDGIDDDKGWVWPPRYSSAADAFRKAHGIPPGRASTDWWDADHIVPVVEGGGECGLSNLRTICIRCHAAETKALAGRRAQARKDAKHLPLLDAV